MTQYLEHRLQPLLKNFDPDALLYVQIKPKTHDVGLPVTPFMLKDLALQSPTGALEIERVDIIVLSKEADIPKPIVKLMRDLTRGLGPAPVIRLRALPVEPKKPVEEEAEEVDAAPVDPTTPYEKNALMYLTALVGLASLLVLAFLFFTHVVRRHLGRLVKALETGTPTGAHLTATATAEPVEFSTVESVFTQMPEDGILALLSDCYWGEYDSYAAYIWKRVPIAKRAQILAKWDLLSDYVTTLGSQKPQNLNLDGEPYYLQPLPIWHVDNKALASHVERSPILIFRLPSLRRGSLELSAVKRVEITKAAIAGKSAPLPDFSKVGASMPRRVRSSSRLQLRTVDEETEVLRLPGVPFEVMEAIPSLGWVAKLPNSEIEYLLKRFTGPELATAWIGPKDVLLRLARALPSAKFHALRKALQAGVLPSRESVVYAKLHELAVTALKKQPPPVAEVEKKKKEKPSKTVAPDGRTTAFAMKPDATKPDPNQKKDAA